MNFLCKGFFKKYLLPGLVFQSVIIGGGYGTGRELVEYFLEYGPVGGLLGMILITTVMWSVFLALTFEFSRRFRAYDYRTFFQQLLGPTPGWIIFEEIYIIFLLIVLAVLGAASGELLHDNFGLHYMVGVAIMLAAVGFLTFVGSGLIEKFLSLWSFVLYAIYAVFFVITFIKLGSAIRGNFAQIEIKPGWAASGFKYAFYNLSAVAALLFCLTHIETRKEAISAGLIAGVIGIVPGLLFYVVMVGSYQEVLPLEVPSVFVFEKTGIKALLIIFQIVLYGTLVETGTAMIHAVNERINAALQFRKKQLPRWMRPLVAIVFLLIAMAASRFGLIDLIDKGYGTLCWGFFFVFLLPLANWALHQMIKSRPILD